MLTTIKTDIAGVRLLDNYSIEITAKDFKSLNDTKELIPAGTPISITFLPNEEFAVRVDAAAAVKGAGFSPVPHIAARRLESETELAGFLDRLHNEAGVDRVFLIAGDPDRPLGPYEDTLQVIKTGVLAKYGITKVGIAGYPDGHPHLSDETLSRALKDKLAALRDRGHDIEIVTQFSFDPDPVVAWLRKLRQAGVSEPVQVGVPGPTSIASLLKFAARSGVGASASVVAKYGISITKILGVAGPEPFIQSLASQLQPEVHGRVSLHFYTFGSLSRTVNWVHDYQAQAGE